MNAVEAMLSKMIAPGDQARVAGENPGASEGEADFAHVLENLPHAAAAQTTRSDAPTARNRLRFQHDDEPASDRAETAVQTRDQLQGQVQAQGRGESPVQFQAQTVVVVEQSLAGQIVPIQQAVEQPVVGEATAEIGNARSRIGPMKSEISIALATLPQRAGSAQTLPVQSPARGGAPVMQAGEEAQASIALPNVRAFKPGAPVGEWGPAPAIDPRATIVARATHFASVQPSAQISEALAFEAPASMPELPDVRLSSADRDAPRPVAGSATSREAVADSARSVVSAAREAASVAPDRTPRPQAAAIDAPENAEPDTQAPGSGLPAGQLERIALAIADDAASPLPDAPASQSVAGKALPAVAAQPTPVRTLTIQLHPEDLGTVEVEMRVNDGALSVKVRATQDDTARLLERDREALTDLLRAAGHDLDSLTIQAPPRETAQAGVDLQSASQRGQAQSSMQGDRQAGAEDRPSEGQPQPRRNPFQQGHENHGKPARESGNGRGLYV